jgi:hypothetical protein
MIDQKYVLADGEKIEDKKEFEHLKKIYVKLRDPEDKALRLFGTTIYPSIPFTLPDGRQYMSKAYYPFPAPYKNWIKQKFGDRLIIKDNLDDVETENLLIEEKQITDLLTFDSRKFLNELEKITNQIFLQKILETARKKKLRAKVKLINEYLTDLEIKDIKQNRYGPVNLSQPNGINPTSNVGLSDF